MRLVYSLLLYALWPLLLLITAVQAYRRDGGWRFFVERMGWSAGDVARGDARAIWFHAASVGEVRSLYPLLSALLEGDKSLAIVITTNTPESQRDLARFLEVQEIAARVRHRYCPVDFFWATRRMVRNIDASALWVVETELWPNLFFTASEAGAQVGIVNGRLSKKTLDAGFVVKSLYRNVLQRVNYVAARSDSDKKAYVELGARPDRTEAVGNLKRVLLTAKSEPESCRELEDKQYVLALSTREGEELLLWQAWKNIDNPLLLVVAPRHIGRGPGIEKSLNAQGANVAVRSRSELPDENTHIYLADTMGETAQFIANAEWVFVGGSLVNCGGHNVLEPAAWGKRVVCGPYTANVEDDVRWLQSVGMLEKVPVEGAEGAFKRLVGSSDNDKTQAALSHLRRESDAILAAYVGLCRLSSDKR